jgi:hypothetical protein
MSFGLAAGKLSRGSESMAVFELWQGIAEKNVESLSLSI